MKTINIHQAKTQLSRLVEEVVAGGEIVIAKAGKPLVKLVSLKAVPGKRRLGILKGKLAVRKDFDQPLPDEILGRFEKSK